MRTPGVTPQTPGGGFVPQTPGGGFVPQTPGSEFVPRTASIPFQPQTPQTPGVGLYPQTPGAGLVPQTPVPSESATPSTPMPITPGGHLWSRITGSSLSRRLLAASKIGSSFIGGGGGATPTVGHSSGSFNQVKLADIMCNINMKLYQALHLKFS